MHNGPGPLTLTSADGRTVLTHDEPVRLHTDGLHFQAAEAARRITAGERETPLRSLADSVLTLEALDRIVDLSG